MDLAATTHQIKQAVGAAGWIEDPRDQEP